MFTTVKTPSNCDKMHTRAEFDIRRCLHHLKRQQKAHLQRLAPDRQEMMNLSNSVTGSPCVSETQETLARGPVKPRASSSTLTASDIRHVFQVWQYRSVFTVCGMVSPAALRRQSRAKDRFSRDAELTLVVYHWDAEGITSRHLVPMTRREAHIWLRKPTLFEDNQVIVQTAMDIWSNTDKSKLSTLSHPLHGQISDMSTSP